jgi:phosphoribosylformylglycinamidine cyclo-ligase
MPDIYKEGDFDVAGFAVGVVELKRATDPDRVEAGDVVIGLASSGVHSNGYTLVRKIIERANLDLGKKYEALCVEPTRIYAKPITKLLRGYTVKKIVTGMAHITGGGLPGNLNRALPDDVDAVIEKSAWSVPPIFGFLQAHGNVDEEEMFRVFNMGIGYCLIVRPTFADAIERKLAKMGETVFRLGTIEQGSGTVQLT